MGSADWWPKVSDPRRSAQAGCADTDPPDGRSSPASSRASVDLPEPFAPVTARASPAETETDVGVSASRVPAG